MYLTKVDLAICMTILGYDIPGEFDVDEYVEEFLKAPSDANVFEHLETQGILEKYEGRFRVSALTQHVFSIIQQNQVKIVIQKTTTKETRILYARGDDYLCVDREKEGFRVLLLPILPFAIGAYAKMLEAIPDVMSAESKNIWTDDAVIITCDIISNLKRVQLFITKNGYTKIIQQEDVCFQYFTEERCVNYLTAMLLEQLRERSGQENGILHKEG